MPGSTSLSSTRAEQSSHFLFFITRDSGKAKERLLFPFISFPKNRMGSPKNRNKHFNMIPSPAQQMTVRTSRLHKLSGTVGNLMKKHNLTLGLAESCTGGLIASLITDIPGSSAYFDSAVVSYSNEAKVELLGVDEGIINVYGAVSRECAIAMAEGIRKNRGVSVSIAVTGIAGPGGGSLQKPVGTVYIALSSTGGTKVEHHHFEGGRNEVRELTAESALQLLLESLESS